MRSNIFQSKARDDGKFAGVFEYADDVGYLYLCDLTKPKKSQIIGGLLAYSELSKAHEFNVLVRWSSSQEIVGVFIDNVLSAAMSTNGQKFGGRLGGREQAVPEEVKRDFGMLD